MVFKNKPIKSLKNNFKRNQLKFYLVLILAFTFFIRTYYLISSKGQTLWWDEAEYMSSAKYWAFGVPYHLNEQRPPIFQLLAAGLLKFGFGETALKFILVLIPSVFLVYIVYLLGKEMFNEKIGLLSSFGTSIIWSILFWSSRFQPDFFSVSLQVLAFLFFWRFIKDPNYKLAAYVGLISAGAFYFKISALLVPLSMFIFSLYYEGFQVFKNKNYWVIVISFFIGLVPFMIWQFFTFGNPLAFGVSYSGDFNDGRDLGWMTFKFYLDFLKPFTLVLLILGILVETSKFLFGLRSFYKSKKFRRNPYILSFIVLIVVSLFYVFYIKGTIEDRWVFLIIPFSFFFVSKAIVFIQDLVKIKSKILGIILLCAYIIFFTLAQLNHTTNLIDNKKSTYFQVKESALLIKDISGPEDKILSVSYTQTTNYAEREVIPYPRMSLENFTKVIDEQKPGYLIASIIEPNHPEWMVKQLKNDEGYNFIVFPYLNSSIVASPGGQIVHYDIKEKVIVGDVTFTLIYPNSNNFGGLVAYKISYN